MTMTQAILEVVGALAVALMCATGLFCIIGAMMDAVADDESPQRTGEQRCSNTAGEHVWSQWKTRDSSSYEVREPTQRRTCEVCGWAEERSL